jgi:hypothetical protein
MLDFWPASPETRAEIGKLLAQMVPHREALDYVLDELINRVGKWPGPKEVRGILCSRYEPADGVDEWCTLPGLNAASGEQRTLLEHEERKLQQASPASNEMLRRLVEGSKWQN